jgi:hypothetical protein
MKKTLVVIFLFLSGFVFSQTSAEPEITITKEKLSKVISIKEIITSISASSNVVVAEYSFMKNGKLCQAKEYKNEIPQALKNSKKGSKIYVDVKVRDTDGKIWATTYVIKLE